MTKRELTRLYYLDKEIEDERQRLAALEMTFAPESELNATRRVIACKLEEAEITRHRLLREIMEIDDIFLRQIFLWRHVDLLTWAAIAVRIGGDNTPDSVRMAHDRYVRTHNSQSAQKPQD